MRNNIISVLDLGSTKVACFIACIEPSGFPKIIGIGHQVSQGIRAGIIIDVKQAETAILSAVNAAEKMAGETIDNVIVNISGTSVSSHSLAIETSVSGHEVTDRDIKQIIAQGVKHYQNDDCEILHCLPTHYTIEDATGIKDPRGMYGEKLSTNLHVVTCSAIAMRNIANCLARCHLNLQDCIASPYASGIACLTEDEKELGVTLVDIGGGSTSISVFRAGHFVYTNSFAIGGNHITRDIALGLTTSTSYAERTKTLYGSAIATTSDEREIIDVPLHDEEEEGQESELMHIPRSALTAIIKPRIEEILELVNKNIQENDMIQATGSRIVLTGGSSQLAGIKELGNHIFGKQVRIGRPKHVEGMADSTRSPAFSAPIGMLKLAAEKQQPHTMEEKNVLVVHKKGQIGKMVRWFQDNF